jgi:predicted PurR-regulated permease PerM
METERQRLSLLVFYALVLLLGYLCYRILEPFLVALAWAGILAMCARPLHRRLTARFRPNAAAGLATAAVALLLIVPTVLLGLALMGEVMPALGSLQQRVVEFYGSDKWTALKRNETLLAAWDWLAQRVEMPSQEEMQRRLAGLAAQVTQFLAGQAGVLLQTSSVFFFKLFISLFALFFFLRDWRALGIAVRKVLPFEEERKEELISRSGDLVYAGTMAILTVAAVQGLVGGLLFAMLGLPAPVFWGVVMGACALLPLFGTALVWLPTSIGLFAMGFWGRGLLLAILGTVLIGGIDNLLRPFLVSGKTQMNGLVVFISIMGGVTAFGFVGLVLGPVLMAAAMSLLQLGVPGGKGGGAA